MVVRRNNIALKLPLKFSTIGLSEANIEYYNIYVDISRQSLNRKKEVYRRLD